MNLFSLYQEKLGTSVTNRMSSDNNVQPGAINLALIHMNYAMR